MPAHTAAELQGTSGSWQAGMAATQAVSAPLPSVTELREVCYRVRAEGPLLEMTCGCIASTSWCGPAESQLSRLRQKAPAGAQVIGWRRPLLWSAAVAGVLPSSPGPGPYLRGQVRDPLAAIQSAAQGGERVRPGPVAAGDRANPVRAGTALPGWSWAVASMAPNTHRPRALQQHPPAGCAQPPADVTGMRVLRRDRLGGLT